jgi:hypothetical protein
MAFSEFPHFIGIFCAFLCYFLLFLFAYLHLTRNR